MEGATTPKSFNEPGLPNLKGKFTLGYGSHHFGTAYGTFNDGDWYYGSNAFSNSPNNPGIWLEFDASHYSSIYKDSVTTVQPKSYTVYYIMKIK